jgi:hypothetical protein
MTKSNTPKPEAYQDWTDVVAAEGDDPAFQALVEQAEADAEAWHREYHATLAQLRRALGRTQAEVAAKMGTAQPKVSELERRGDVLVSTARAFVEALGGELELVVHFPDGRTVTIDLGELAEAG